MFTADEYLSLILSLYPTGPIWSRDPNSNQGQIQAPLARSYAATDAAAEALLVDAFPRAPVNLLPEWESTLGLPDPCAGDEPTLADRQSQVLARFTDGGGASTAYYEAFAASLGYTITITTCRPYQVGDPVGMPLYDERWLGVWRVTVSGGRYDLATLQCELLARAPAHTVIIFSTDFSTGDTAGFGDFTFGVNTF